MKKGDFIWLLVLLSVVFIIVSPWTNPTFEHFTSTHLYLGGFAKFFILAPMGELLAIRLVEGNYRKPTGLLVKAFMWGLFGMLISLIFNLFAGGINSVMEKGYLPFYGNKFAFAFFVGSTMNLFFAPVFMGLHKLSDTYIDLKFSGQIKSPTMDDVLQTADWETFVKFVLFKTIPLFWIPAHTLTFLAPPQYRIVISAFLSIVLGIIMVFAKNGKSKKATPVTA